MREHLKSKDAHLDNIPFMKTKFHITDAMFASVEKKRKKILDKFGLDPWEIGSLKTYKFEAEPNTLKIDKKVFTRDEIIADEANKIASEDLKARIEEISYKEIVKKRGYFHAKVDNPYSKDKSSKGNLQTK